MGKPIRVLMLEDSRDDALLIQKILQRAALVLDTKLVDSRQGFIEQLHAFAPDIVLSDHQLPQFSSTEALGICRESYPFMPFILVTGAVSEEFAASIIKAGADDYLLKNNLVRLPLAMTQAMEKQATRKAFLQSEANLRNILENTDTAYLLMDTAFTILSYNSIFVDFIRLEMGLTVEQGQHFNDIIMPERHDLLRQVSSQVLKGQSIQYDMEYVIGIGRWYNFRYSPVRNTDREIVGIAVAITNITSRKLADQKLLAAHQQLTFHIENAPLGFIQWDNQMLLQSWSGRTEEIFGWSEQEYKENQQSGYKLVHSDDVSRVKKVADELITGKVTKNHIVNRNYTKAGKVIWCEWYNSVIKDDAGKVTSILSLVQDITDKKEAEIQLEQSNERYELVSRATSDAIWDWDIEKDLIHWNHGLKTLFGHNITETTNTVGWWDDHVHPEDLVRINEELEKQFARLDPNYISFYRYKCADGTYRHVFDRAIILYKFGKPVRMIGAMQDIEDRVKAMEEVKKLSIVASKTVNGVIIANAQHEIEWVNEGFTTLTGYSPQEAIGKKPFELLHGPETDNSLAKRIDEKIGALEPFSWDIVNYAKSGKKYWVRLNITPIADSSGRLDRTIAIHEDISAQKEFEEKILNIARELSDLIENANTPIFGTDRSGYVNEWNKVTEQLTGYSKNDALGKKFLENFVRDTDKAKFTFILNNVLRDQPVSNLEIPIVTRDKEDIIILLNATPRKNVTHEITGILMVGQNITELISYRKNLEEMVEKRTHELNEALLKEKDLVEMKTRFVSVASHEFRTPLSTISLAAESIRNHFHQLKEEDIQRKLLKIEDQAQHMNNLLEDVLTVGKSEAGKIKVKRIRLDLKEFCETLVEEARATAKAKRVIDFSFASIQSEVTIDDRLFRNIFVNLLTNAIKFSPVESTVHVSIEDYKDGVMLTVSDEGIGIGPEDLESVFEAFHRGTNVSQVQGTGLGLSITKKAVDLMNGYIHVDSELDKGTTFKVQIPT